MARLARVVLAGVPHHCTQPDNGRARKFLGEADDGLYLSPPGARCRRSALGVRGRCPMPNHVHPILTPSDPDGLRRALPRVHRAYAGHVHAREQRTGHFRQGRNGWPAVP